MQTKELSMKKLDFEALVARIEKGSFQYDFEIPGVFRDAADSNDLTKVQNREFESEFFAFRLMTKYDLNKKVARLSPSIVWQDGSTHPNMQDIKDRATYYLRRFKKTTNPIMKTRYADITYEFNKQMDRDKFAPKLVQTHIDASRITSIGEITRIDCIARAFIVAKRHEQSHPKQYEYARGNVIEALNHFTEQNLRWCIDLIEILLKYKDAFMPKEWAIAKSSAGKGITFYSNNNGFLILESFIKLKHSINEKVFPQQYDKKDLSRELAQFHIELATKHEDSLIAKQHQLLKAAGIYREAGLQEEASQVELQVEQLGKASGFSRQFQKLEYTIKPPKELHQLAEQFVACKDKIGMLALFFTPSYQKAQKQARSNPPSIQDLVTTIGYDENNMPISSSSDSSEENAIKRNYRDHVSEAVATLSLVLTKALQDEKFKYDDIKCHIVKIKFINLGMYETVKTGFKYFFGKKYFEALSILTPQLEAFIRYVAGRAQIPKYKTTKK